MKTVTNAICAAVFVTLLSGVAVAKDSVSIGMRLEPAPGLDPTTGAAAAISQVTLYNIFEGLTRIGRFRRRPSHARQVLDDLRRRHNLHVQPRAGGEVS